MTWAGHGRYFIRMLCKYWDYYWGSVGSSIPPSVFIVVFQPHDKLVARYDSSMYYDTNAAVLVLPIVLSIIIVVLTSNDELLAR